MAKKKSWFQLVRKFFISEAKTNDKPSEKKVKKRKRWFFGRFKLKSLPVIEAPPLLQKHRALIQAEENHSKHALTAAIATAAAAEAAVAAAQAAAEIVRLTGGPHRTEIRANDLAAIRIQTAFRGYLARKALRALKGLVRLQAMVRGRAVRRQVITSLQELQSLVKIQTRVREWKAKMAENSRIDAEKEHFLCQTKELKDKEPTIKINTQKWCGESLPIKEGCNATTLSRLESSMRRKHIREYFLSHQERKNVETLTESEPHNVKERLNQYWLENWVDSHERREGEENNNGSVVSSYPLMQKDIEETSQPKLGELIGLTTVSLPRRSFHHQPKRHSIGESFSRSPTVPNYMSATESAKAKARSNSTPKQRSSYQDTCSDHDSPLKNRLSFSSVGSDSNTTPVKNGKPPSSIPQISPRMKRLLGPIKSHKTSKDLSIDSECSLLNLDPNNFFR